MSSDVVGHITTIAAAGDAHAVFINPGKSANGFIYKLQAVIIRLCTSAISHILVLPAVAAATSWITANDAEAFCSKGLVF